MRRLALRLRSQAQRPSTARWAARSASSLSSRPAPSSSAHASPLSASRIAVVGAACVGVATGGGATFTTHASSAPHGASAPASYLRVMLPDDANPAGNVHGGTILKMIEMAGYIAATRHANKLNGSEKQAPPLPPAHAHIARIDHMDFLEVRPAVCLAPERGWGGMAGWTSLPRARATEIAFCPTATANPLWIGTNTCSPSSNALSLNIYALSVNLLTHSLFLSTHSPPLSPCSLAKSPVSMPRSNTPLRTLSRYLASPSVSQTHSLVWSLHPTLLVIRRTHVSRFALLARSTHSNSNVPKLHSFHSATLPSCALLTLISPHSPHPPPPPTPR